MEDAPKDGTVIEATNTVMRENGQTMFVKWGYFETKYLGQTLKGHDWLLVGHAPPDDWVRSGIGEPCRPTHWAPVE